MRLINCSFLLFALVLSVAAHAAPAPREMTFQVMRAAPSSCEPSCPEWIYAQGEIVGRSVSQFEKTIKRAGRVPPLVIIQSGGGDVRAAMALGRSIRAHKMKVAVGFAMPLVCAAGDDVCLGLMKPHGMVRGLVPSVPSYCASACTLVLAAGVERMADGASVIGTHQILNKPIFQRIFYREKYLLINGKKKIISKTITKRETFNGKPTTKMTPKFDAELERYVKAMGVDKQFLSFYSKAPPSGIYKMTPKERLATRIITTETGPDKLAAASRCSGAEPPETCVILKY
ncbi:MAG: hypothetical protein KGO94_01130 [Alphaproteobacteria bacterium]|nr:hypothetical protein [Alphaproteobacteria bacterium]